MTLWATFVLVIVISSIIAALLTFIGWLYDDVNNVWVPILLIFIFMFSSFALVQNDRMAAQQQTPAQEVSNAPGVTEYPGEVVQIAGGDTPILLCKDGSVWHRNRGNWTKIKEGTPKVEVSK